MGRLLCVVLFAAACQTPAERDLAALLDHARSARAAGDRAAALVAVSDALGRARSAEVAPRLRRRLDAEVDATARTLEATLLERDPPPLELEARLTRVKDVLALPELAHVARKLDAELARRARAACSRLGPLDGPHTRALVRRYCRHLRVAPPPALPLPETFNGLELTAAVREVEPTRATALARRLEDAFAGSPFHDAAARATLRGALGGHFRVGFASRRVTVDAPWVEQVPYTAHETYQQAYTDYETYTTQVPYTVYESYTYNCGSGSQYRSCTGSRPRTQYRSETRTRPVTRYRPATRVVTRYRGEPRVFRFDAVRVTGSYDDALTLRIQLDAGAPLLVRAGTLVIKEGLDHDASFPPAGVHPSRPNLPDAETWWGEASAALERALLGTLRGLWQSRFCAAPRYDVESAARCLRGADAPLPEPVAAALMTSFGADARRLASLPPE